MANHKHFEIIKAWKEGHKVETYITSLGIWVEDRNPHFSPDAQYRIKWEKPEYKIEAAKFDKQYNAAYNEFVPETLKFSWDWSCEICDSSFDELKNTITIYDYVKLFKFKNDYHVGTDDIHDNNVKYTFDADTKKLISVELI
jgi:hypothetical protein